MKATKKQKASAFLCVVLAGVVLFVSAVCIFISKRNKKIEAGLISPSQSESLSEQESAKADEETPFAASSTEQKESENAVKNTSTQSGGTLQNPKEITVDASNLYLTLVNSGLRINESYTPNLVYVCKSSEKLEKTAAEHYEAMYEAAQKEGLTLTPCSGYRSFALQQQNYENKAAYYESIGYSKKEALIKAAAVIMPAGSSEHNLGLAMDIVCAEDRFADTEEFKWLTLHAADYGFILRYPADKTAITKVVYEPWHWRYVGVENAKKIKESGLCLEEYIGG